MTQYGNNEESYYVYPSFAKTLAFLAKKEITVRSAADMGNSVTVHYQTGAGTGEVSCQTDSDTAQKLE